MTILERIRRDLKDAMKRGEKERLSALRMILSNVKNSQIEKKKPLSDEEIIRIIQRLVRQSEDAMRQFSQGNRTDLVEKEKAFISFCQTYLPEQLGERELITLIQNTISEIGATHPKEMGKVMKAVMPKVAGRADGKRINRIVRAVLSENSP